MEVAVDNSAENNTQSDENPAPDKQISYNSVSKLESESESTSSQISDCDKSTSIETSNSSTTANPFFSYLPKTPHQKNIFRKHQHFLGDLSEPCQKQKPDVVSTDVRSYFFNSLSNEDLLVSGVYNHTQNSYVGGKLGHGATARYAVSSGPDLGNEGTQFLLPETSGFSSFNQGTIIELKRGRGRPRKEGSNPQLPKLSSHCLGRGLDRAARRSFGSRDNSRGLRKNLGRSFVRSSRSGRRGRPPLFHTGPLVTSLSCEAEFSNPLFFPEEPPQASSVTRPDILSTSEMSDYLKQSTISATGGPDSAPASLSASPIPGAHSSSLPPDVPMTPESQNMGHLCALCNCGERSLLGQGETWRFEPSERFDVFKLPDPKTLREADEIDTVGKSKGPQPTTWRRSRGPLKTGRERSRSPRQSGEKDSTGCQVSDELSLVGFHDDTEVSQLFESTGHVWVHYCCALWSEGVSIGESSQLELVDKAVYNSMSHRCAQCRKFGATVVCYIPECGKRFHFPCASAGGCFQDMKKLLLLCLDHIDQAEAVAGSAACCIQCGLVGCVKEQLFCTSCGHHYHGNCLCPPVDMKPIVRAGWQCPNCKICQTCRTAGEDSKMLVCDKCDKGYHTFCLKPVMTTIPKNGWKCKSCRICTDCGSRTPGSGPSSRWHLNYSVCDSCYQQRNKGLCCPLCGKAYRHFHNKTMLPCTLCKKYVHIECDPSINPSKVEKLKDLPQDYICTVCREAESDSMMDMDQPLPSLSHAASEESMESFLTDDLVSKDDPMLTEAALSTPTIVSTGAVGGLTVSASQDSLLMADDSSSSMDFDTSDRSMMSPSSRRDSFEFSKKGRQKSKHSSTEKHHHHLNSHQHNQQIHQPNQQQQGTQLPSLIEKRRGPKIKVKIGGQVMGITSIEGGSSPIQQHSLSQPAFSASSPACSVQSADGQVEEKEKDKKDDDDEDGDDHPSTLILAESSDSFIMDQDICKACGSFGKDEESRMIVCTQCGQCYHPYCVSVTVTRVILQKGWRCLDCTVCEGCGGPYDEGRLLLCDDCDISYHTYCLDPPLNTVPKGNWKCKWCVTCVNCGSTSPGFSCQWMNNYTQCGPCHSKIYCPVCLDSYLIDQLIIQCQQCERWLHCECDGLTCEDEAELAADYGYHCVFCRPQTGKDGPLPPPPPPPSPPKEERAPSPPPILSYVTPTPEPPRHFFVDGVYLYQSGLSQIQRLQVTNPKKYKQQHQQLQRRISQWDDQDDVSSVTGAGGGEDQGGQEEIGEDGVKKRKPRRVFGLGVGGFIVRQRSRQWLAKRQASYEEQEDQDKGDIQTGDKSDKPKRRRKAKKSKLEVAFPFYMQEAFFGRSILEQTKETTKGLLKTESDSEQEEHSPTRVVPSTDNSGLKAAADSDGGITVSGPGTLPRPHTSMSGSEQSEDIHSLDESDLKDILHEFQETDDIFSIIHEELKDDGLSLDGMETMTNKEPGSSKTSELPDNLENMLHSDMDKELDVEDMITGGLVHFDSKTVEDIFSGVLSEPQSNQSGESGTTTAQYNMPLQQRMPGTSQGQSHPTPHTGMSSQSPGMIGAIGSQPVSASSSLPSFGMPYSSQFSHQISQNFPQGISQGLVASQGQSSSIPPWGLMDDDTGDSNKRTILKWEQEEDMGDQATISCVLYVNMCHPDLKQKYPEWSERSKQIAKLWRKLTPDEKAPYLSKARKNRTSSRVQKAQKQVSQELQRRQEIQKQQDSEAMPPPPAPPPLTPGELYHDGPAPGLILHPSASPYARHSWQEDAHGLKPSSTPGTPDHTGPPTDQVFMQQGLAPTGGINSPDPYGFDPFSPIQTRPGVRPSQRLPGLQAFGASSPRDDDSLFNAPGMSARVHPSPDMFGHGGPATGQDMFMGSPRRPPGLGPQMTIPSSADTISQIGESNKPRVASDPYVFVPSTPQTPVPDDPFLPPGPPTPDVYHPGRRGDMFPGGTPQMRTSLTPISLGSNQGSPYPGSPVRMPDSNFRHPLSRSNSLPDPYSMQIGTPRPQIDPPMARCLAEVSPEPSQMYRDGRMTLPLPEEGVETQGNMHHQQLRVILGQQTKQRMAKKQEEAERMMQGPSTGWQGPPGTETVESYQPQPPFRGPSPQGFMRSPHSGIVPQGARPVFFSGPGGMQRSHSEVYPSPSQEAIMADQRNQYMQMMQERLNQPANPASSSPMPLPAPHAIGGNLPQYIAQANEAGMLRPQPPPTAGNSGVALSRPGPTHGGDDEIFTENEVPQPSTSKAPGGEDATPVESDSLLEGIGKAAKPSLSSEEDKNEDDDLLSADGTFDILKYADPDLDLDLDDKMFDHLDFMEEQGNGQGGEQKKSDEEKSEDSKDIVKEDKDLKGTSSRTTDFQAQFLEFNERQKCEAALKEKEESDKTEEEKSDVGQIAVMLQNTETMSVRLAGGDSGPPDVKPSGADIGMASGTISRTNFKPIMASPHMSPSQVPAQPGSSGLPSPKIMHSPRSGQPSPRTPGIQSPFNTLIGGRHSASPHSQPMTPGGPQLSPFSGSVQIPFSPPTSTGGPQSYGQGPGSAPQSPYTPSSQATFASMPPTGPPHMISPSFSPGGMALRPMQSFHQMGHPGAPRGPLYGQTSHGIRPGDGQPNRFPRPVEASMDGTENLGSCIPQPMTLPDGRPHPMYQQMQARGMRGPPPPGHPSLPSQLTHQQNRHAFPGHPPRLSHPAQVQVCGVGPRQPGPPFPGTSSQCQTAQREQITLLDDLVEKEKEEQKRQAEQQAMMHRRDGGVVPGEQAMIHRRDGLAVPGDQAMPVMSPAMPAGAPPPLSVGVMPLRMDHPNIRMVCPPDSASSGWSGEAALGGPPPGQFQPGFSSRMMHPGMPQRPPLPFSGPPESRAPGPSNPVPAPGQAIPLGPPTPVSPPSGEVGPDYERQANMYEDWLAKQSMYLESQVKMFEGQVNKLKRSKKTIQARQRLAKKNGQELNPTDTTELERIGTEQSNLQKQLEAQRKLLRQHQHLMQDYKTKQQEQFGRMWTGGMAETAIPGGPIPPMSHPRTPGGHNSVRLSPTARQEYEAYMQNRLRQANQMQQQNRMRPPTTILGDNNPFSEAFQQREQMQRAPQSAGAGIPQSPGTPTGPPPTILPSSGAPPPVRAPFGMGSSETVSNSVVGAVPSTSTVPSSSTALTSSSSSAPLHIPAGPLPAAQSVTPASAGQPVTTGTQSQIIPSIHPTNSSGGPRGPVEGMGAVQFFRERNIPFEGSAGPRFPRPLGPGTYPNSPGPGQGQSPRLPPYSGSPGMYPQTAGPGSGIEQGRLPFQAGMTYQPGIAIASPQILDVPQASQTVVKEKKKRKKKKKSDELEGVQSQPLPMTLPNQTVIGQISSQPSSVMSSSNSSGPTTKPAELPRPQSETERRILEILNNSQKELQNPASPSSARGGKSPRSRSPARAQPVITSEVEKVHTGGSAALSANTSMSGDAHMTSQPMSMSGMSDGAPPLTSCAFAGDKMRPADAKNMQTGGYAGTITSISESVGIPTQPTQHVQQRVAVHTPQVAGPMPAGFQSQQHMHQLQTLARLQQFQQQQFAGLPEGPRVDSQSLNVCGPRYQQIQRFPPGIGQPPHPFHGRPPHLRPGNTQYLPQGMSVRVPSDPRMSGTETHLMPPHASLQQRIPLSTSSVPPHIRQPAAMQQGTPLSNQTLPPGSPQTNQAPLLSHMPSDSPIPFYQGLPTGISSSAMPILAVTSASQTSVSISVTATSFSELLPATSTVMPVPPSLVTSSMQPPPPPADQSSSTAQVKSQLSSVTTYIPGEINQNQSPSSGSAALSASSTAPSLTTVEKMDSSTPSEANKDGQGDTLTKIPDDSNNCVTDNEDAHHVNLGSQSICNDGTDDEGDNVRIKSKKVCDDGVHCGTDDEDDLNVGSKSKNVCDDGVHCGTDDENDLNVGSKSKKVCDDGIHCGTDDEDDLNVGSKSKNVCDDGVHCGTDDEDDMNVRSKSKKVCDDGVHCGTDDEDDLNFGSKSNKVCDDGVHCGTDDEDDMNVRSKSKKVCDDGVHCGTDDEYDLNFGSKPNKVCDDGVHCGTDDEDDMNVRSKSKKVCDDGVHCGTDDEDDLNVGSKSKKVCDDGVHCGTDDEDDLNVGSKSKKVCDDGIHCGTDDEDDKVRSKSKKVCDDGVHCGTDDEDDLNVGSKSKKVCDDGVHCGTDDEGDDKIQTNNTCTDGVHCAGTDNNNGQNNSSVETSSPSQQPASSPPSVAFASSAETALQSVVVTLEASDSSCSSSGLEKPEAEISTLNCQPDACTDLEETSQSFSIAPAAVLNCDNDNSQVAFHHNSSGFRSQNPLKSAAKIEADAINEFRSEKDSTEVLSQPLPLSGSKAVISSVISAGPSVPMVSIDSQVSSQLAAVSRSLAYYKPRLGSDSSETSADTVRPSETLTAFSFAASSPQSVEVTTSTAAEMEVQNPGKLSEQQKSIGSSESKESSKCEVVSQSAFDKSQQVKDKDVSQQKCEKILLPSNIPSKPHRGEDFLFSFTGGSSQSVSKLSDSATVVRVQTPVTAPCSFSVCSTSAQDTIPLVSVPASLKSGITSSSTPVSSAAITALHLPPSHAQSVSSGTLPAPVSQVTKSWIIPPPTANTAILAEGHQGSVFTSSSSSRGGTSESRPIIPPLRIRMDGQSQPQVYESTALSRDSQRSSSVSEFTTSHMRSKTEGDLKLVLRKSSDGTAELISGPSYREKTKRSSIVPDVVESRTESDQRMLTSPSGSLPVSVSFSSFSGSASTESILCQSVSMTQSSCNIKNTESTQSSVSLSSLASPPIMSSGVPQVPTTLPASSSSTSPAQTPLLLQSPASSTVFTSPTEKNEPIMLKPGLFRNISYTKSPDTDVVKINVGCTKTSGEVTKKVIRSYTTDIQALERLQSTIDAVASGESSYEPDLDSQPSSRPESREDRSSSTPSSTTDSFVPATTVALSMLDAPLTSSGCYSSPSGSQHQQHLHQMNKQVGPQQRQLIPQHQQSSTFMPQPHPGFSQHQPFHPPRMTRPPLDLLAQVSQSALSSAGTAIPSPVHPSTQEQRPPYMTERSPSGSSDHSPLHTSPHQPYPGMMGPRPIASSPGVSPKAAAGQTCQAYIPSSGPQQQFISGVQFPSRLHHDMTGASPYGMTAHPMSPTGTGMHRQRPPHFGMGGDISRMARPPRGMAHPSHRPLPPEMMAPDHGMHSRMPHQFMTDMSPTSHGLPHPGLPQSAHGMQRPPMMGPHHPIMPGGPPVSYSQAPMSGSGGPLASLANFHPPGHPGVNTIPGVHHQRPPVFQQMIGGDGRMASQLRMLSSPSDSTHMAAHYRHMIMRGMTPPVPQPSPQISPQMSPHMSPQMSPQMSPVMQTQPLRHLDNIPDEKNFIPSISLGSSLGLPTGMVDPSMTLGGKTKPQRPFGAGILQGDSGGYLPVHQQHHTQAASDSGSVTSTPGLTSPMSDTAVSISGQVKLEPSEDSVSADGSITRDDLDLDQKANHNELLKQLLGTGQGGRQLPTPDSEDSLPSLTPEQQRQLEMIDSMPLCKETEISTPEWESKTPEEKDKILEMRRQEYEQKRQEYEVSRKNKRKAVIGSNTPVEKKKRKAKGVGAVEIGVEIPRKRSKKSKMKESQQKELEAQVETFLQQLHNMPPIPLQEPVIATSMSILPLKGTPNLNGVSVLRGRFCSAYVDGIEDIYGSLLFPQPPAGLRPTVPSAEILAQRQLASEAKFRMVQGMDPLLMLKGKDGGAVIGARPSLCTSPRLILPPQPRIEIKSEQMRDKKDDRETPDTVVSSSSPEFGFNEQEPEFPGLRLIDPAASHAISPIESTSPVVPLVQPLPMKPAYTGMDHQVSELGVKPELGLIKQDSSDHDTGLEPPDHDLTVNLPNLTSGLAQPFLDPALDQQVSVTLTLSTGAAQDIGAVISAIADLLKIAVPPTYEITRSPSPEMFRMSLTHKEEAVNIHTLMSTRPRFCQHCDVFVLCSGIAKYKREFPILLDQEPDCGDEEMIFCSMNCSMQFSAALEARQRQAQLRLKELEASDLASQTPPPSLPVKQETPTSTSVQTPSSATIAANMDEVIAAVAADMSLSPTEPDTPGDVSASPGTPSTTPTSPLPTILSMKLAKRNRRSSSQVSDCPKPLVKKWRGLRWKRGNQELLDDITKIPPTPTFELDKVWDSLGIIHRPKADVEDKRKCVFCQNVGDGDCDGPSRLLNMDVNKWVHLNCALWSYDVYETLNGALMHVELAFQRSLTSECIACRKMGATLACFKPRCVNAYHLPCARLKGCMFYQDKTLLCPTHSPKMLLGTEITSLVVFRRVYINRDEDRQVASMIHQEEGHCSLRIGSLILHSIGQLLPHQLLCGKFNTKDCIYPVGFKTSRFYWSYFSLYKRCRYVCSIHDCDGEPEFRIQIVALGHEEIIFKDSSPAAVWMHILRPLERMRREADLVKMFPTFMAAEELFGLTEPNVVKVLESLPGTDLLTNYNFKFGRSPLIEMPPAINPTGCARTEPKLRTHFRRPHTLQSTNSRSLPSTVTGVTGDMNSPYLKQFVHSKSQQYRRLKTDWKSLVYLGRSRIQGLGLYAARDLEKHTMVIEYIGDLIRNEVANRREKEYEAQNRGVYMFRIDNEVVIDATKAGGPARYINHSCSPNCVAEVVDIERDSKIIIITSRKIVKGEELTYDYKFDFEDDQHKIPCMCGATNCRKWMN